MNESLENQKYKNVIESTLKSNEQDFCPFRKEKQMNYLFSFLSRDFERKGLKVLDACCGYGRLIYFLNEFDPQQSYVGIDYVEELIKKGQGEFSDKSNIAFESYDVMKLSEKYSKEFDVSINYKTLSWLPYYKTIVEELVKVTKSKIYITSLFYEGDIDFITKIYTSASQDNPSDYTYLNTYSLPKFRGYCKSLGIKEVNSIDMSLDFDLPKNDDIDKLATHTILRNDGSRMEVTGNVILNWKLLEIVL